MLIAAPIRQRLAAWPRFAVAGAGGVLVLDGARMAFDAADGSTPDLSLDLLLAVVAALGAGAILAVVVGVGVFAPLTRSKRRPLRVRSLVAVGLALAVLLATATADRFLFGAAAGRLRLVAALGAVTAAALAAGVAGEGRASRPLRAVAVALVAAGILGGVAALSPSGRGYSATALATKTVFGRSVAGLFAYAMPPAPPTPPGAETARLPIDLFADVPSDASDLDARFPERRRFNVVVLTLDTLRADHVSHLGYSRPTTPMVDRFAMGAATFRRARAQYPSSRYSIASFLSSRYPTRTHAYRRDRARGEEEVSRLSSYLAEDLRGARRRTAAITAMDRGIEQRHFDFLRTGFDSFDGAGESEPEAADRVTDRALAALEGLSEREPFHLWVHYFDAHAPYVAHDDHDFGAGDVDRYDGEIAFMDAHVGRLLDRLARRADWDETVVVIHSDHGEEFLEHGGRFHGTSLHDESIRVPLIVRVPGARPAIVDDPVELIDVKPTLLELLAVERAGSTDGQSLLPEIAGLPRKRRLPPAFAQIREGIALGVRADAVADGDWKAILDHATGLRSAYRLSADARESIDLGRAGIAVPPELDAWLAVFRRVDEDFSDAAIGDSDRLRAASADVRREALRRLDLDDRLGSLDASIWKRLTADADPEIRASVLRFLMRERCPLAYDGLAHVVATSADATDRRRAAHALAVIGDRRALRVFDAAEGAGWRESMLPAYRGLLGDLRAKASVAAAFETVWGEDRVPALAAASALDIPGAAETLSTLIQGEFAPGELDPQLIEIASRNGDPQVLLSYYTRIALRPTRPAIFRRVLDALSRYCSRDVAPILRLALRYPNAEIRARAGAKLEADGLGWWRNYLEDGQDASTAAAGAAVSDAHFKEAAKRLRAAARRAHAAGVPDWGLAIEAWGYSQSAGSKDEAAADAEDWSKRRLLPTFAADALGRLAAVSRADQPLRLEVSWVVADDIGAVGSSWFGLMAVAGKAGAAAGAFTRDGVAAHVAIRAARGGPVLAETLQPFPATGIAAGETKSVPLVAAIPSLDGPTFFVLVTIVRDGLPVAPPLEREVRIVGR